MDDGKNHEQAQIQELKHALRKFTVAFAQPGVRGQRIALCSLLSALRSAETSSTYHLPNSALKALIHHLVIGGLNRFAERRSFILAEELLRFLASKNTQFLLHSLADEVTSLISSSKSQPVKGTSHKAVLMAKWLLSVIECNKDMSLIKKDKETQKRIVIGLASIAFFAVAFKRDRLKLSAVLKVLLRSMSLDDILETLQSVNAEDQRSHGKCLAFLYCLPLTQSQEKIANLFTEFYTKGILLAKSRQPVHIMISCEHIAELLTLTQFESEVLPVAKKAMLRSPEVAAFGLCSLLSALKFDLSTSSNDIYKITSASLISTSDEIRENAALIIKLLAVKISDSSAVSDLIKGLLKTYSGAEGKVTQPVQRITILETLEKVSLHGVYGKDTCDALSEEAIEGIVHLLPSELHEGTLSAMWNSIVAWSRRMSHLASCLRPVLKESLKGAGASRSIALTAFVTIFSSLGYDVLDADLLDELRNLRKWNGSSSELLAALLILLNSDQVEDKNNIHQSACTMDVFYKDKFISSLRESDAVLLTALCEKLIVDRPFNESEKHSYAEVAIRSLFIPLYWPNHQLRNRALAALKRIVAAEGVPFCAVFLNRLCEAIGSGQLDQTYKTIASVQQTTVEGKAPCIPGHSILPSVNACLISFDLADESSTNLSNFISSALLVCCNPRIAEIDSSKWLRWLSQVKRYEELLKMDDSLVKSVVTSVFKSEDSSVRLNAIGLLMSSNHVALPFRHEIWSYCENLMSRIKVESFTNIMERDIAIFNTPDGVLYNTDVIDQNSDEALQEKNVKRESKVYKYKEQVFEMQLRKELAEKRRNEGRLTERQKKAVEAEIQSERVVRDQLRGMYNDCAGRLDALSIVVHGNPSGSTEHIDLLLSVVIPLLKSRLVTRPAFECFRSFRDAAFEPSDDYLHELVLHSSARVLGSAYCDKAWSEEAVSTQLERTIGLLLARCVLIPSMENGCAEDEESIDGGLDGDDERMNVHKLAFMIPMLNSVLRDSSQSYALRFNSIQLLSSALSESFINGSDVGLLPLNYITSLLLFLVRSDATELSHLAETALLNLVTLVDSCPEKVSSMHQMISLVLDCLDSPITTTRASVLRVLSKPKELYRYFLSDKSCAAFVSFFTSKVFIARFDQNNDCAKMASVIWHESSFNSSESMCLSVIDSLINNEKFMRTSASHALEALIEEYPSQLAPVLERLNELYCDFKEVRGAKFDEIGRMISEPVDAWQQRAGIAEALILLAQHLPEEMTLQFVNIIVPQGLDDRNPECLDLMRKAAIEAIKKHGAKKMSELLPSLEDALSSTPSDERYDNLRQGLILLLGTLAAHLDPSNDKVRTIAARLIEALSTPSQQIQEAVSKCLPPLVPAIKDNAKELATKLTCLLFEADSYGERRGAAYGLAGLIKGLGMSAIRELELIKTLQSSLSDTRNPKRREGALLALEMLCSTMGKLFEPYIVQVLPSLLICFGDTNENVRRAADDTAKALMSMLTAHGVKLVLPSLLAALDEESWRTKCASVELLGAMAFCAPKQLSACLPSIVPKLLEVLADSHSKVQRSGEKALKQIAKVIRNPEILGISSHLLAGLVDPATKTSSCLQTIVNTKFIHYIDAASLALIMPIVRRAFTDRNTETRRMAAQIIANIYSLADNKDMEPYLCELVPGLQKSLLDPVPEIRTVAAKALGAIVACSTGDTSIRLREQIVPWLKEKLVSDTSSVDRSGAAQGLSEVLKSLGDEQLNYVMPDIIRTTECETVSPEVRDGYILMYIYIPMVFGDQFVQYLPQVIPSILKALADENEYVRDSALKAGQRLITMFCTHARRLFLPQLQAALVDRNWRIRYASVTLIGDFLFNISGVSGKMTSATSSEDDTMGIEAAGKAIIRQLGQNCRDKVLAGIYLSRSDVALSVRQAASHVWKVVVANTPRTLKEIMKTLFEILLSCLASDSEDRQQMAARCLGELVKKMGERILIDILPVLEQGLSSPMLEQRQGVAIALNEIIENTPKDIIQMYTMQLIGPIKLSLTDKESVVRKSSASTFTSLFQSIGQQAFDDIIAPLLEKVQHEDNTEDILDGLSECMKLNSRQMLAYVLPKLTSAPVNAKALCALAAVAGDSLTRNLARILDSLLDNCSSVDQIDQCLDVVLTVNDEEGVAVVVSTLLNRSRQFDHLPSAALLHQFVKNTKADLSGLAGDILLNAVLLYNSSNSEVVENAIGTLMALVQMLDQRELLAALPTLKQALNSLHSISVKTEIPGLSHPKAIQPLAPILREGILSGGVDVKEMAANTLGILLKMCTATALKAHVVGITGPLIRVLGDRYPASVKLSILNALSVLLDKVDATLRPFLPQLQSTFLKALQEPSSQPVRLCAGGALSRLITIHPKPEPIVMELVKLLSNCDDPALIETTLVCLRALIEKASNKLSVTVLDAVKTVSEKHSGSSVESAAFAAASALYGECLFHSNSLSSQFLIEATNSADVRQSHSRSIALEEICLTHAAEVIELFGINELRTTLSKLLQSDKAFVAIAAIRAATAVLIADRSNIDLQLLNMVVRSVNHTSNDVKRIAAVGVHHIALGHLTARELKTIVPMMVNGTKEKNTAVRAQCEYTLIEALKLRKDKSVYEAYVSGLEGAARDVLEEVYNRSLCRAMKQDDPGVDPITDIVSVP